MFDLSTEHPVLGFIAYVNNKPFANKLARYEEGIIEFLNSNADEKLKVALLTNICAGIKSSEQITLDTLVLNATQDEDRQDSE